MKLSKLLLFSGVFLLNNFLFSQGIGDISIEEYPLKSISCFCQSNPDSLYSKTTFIYDNLNKLSEKKIYLRGFGPFHTNYTIKYSYNENGLVSSKLVIRQVKGYDKTERTRIYKYDNNNRLIYEGYDDNNGNNTENRYVYSENNSVKEKIQECNNNKFSYTYEYDEKGRIISEYRNNSLMFEYEYSEELLIKKIEYFGSRESVIIYEYDANNNLVLVKQNDIIIEQNEYDRNSMIKKIENKRGKDLCRGRYIKKYNYYNE